MENLGKLTAGIIMIIIASFITGLTLSILWEWFIVPIFDVRNLGIIEAVGLSFTIGYVFHKKNKDTNTMEENIELAVYIVIYSLLVLGMGYIYHLFM